MVGKNTSIYSRYVPYSCFLLWINILLFYCNIFVRWDVFMNVNLPLCSPSPNTCRGQKTLVTQASLGSVIWNRCESPFGDLLFTISILINGHSLRETCQTNYYYYCYYYWELHMPLHLVYLHKRQSTRRKSKTNNNRIKCMLFGQPVGMLYYYCILIIIYLP